MIKLKYLYRLLTLISPTLNNQFIYFVFHRKFLNLRHPKTLNEKLVKLKLTQYNKSPLVKHCADKFQVRDYISKKGLADILIPLIAAYDKIDDVKWDELPNKFVLKLNSGRGHNIVCTNRNDLDLKTTTETLHKWSKEKQYLENAELQYKDVPLKIIVEQFLHSDHGTVPADYKVYCFNGKPQAVLFMDDRGEHTKAAFFDMDWNYISEPLHSHYEHFSELPEKPLCMQQMIEVSKKMAAPFPFVRMDYYCVGDKLYFGEMTFTPAAGLFTSECLINGHPMGDYLRL